MAYVISGVIGAGCSEPFRLWVRATQTGDPRVIWDAPLSGAVIAALWMLSAYPPAEFNHRADVTEMLRASLGL